MPPCSSASAASWKLRLTWQRRPKILRCVHSCYSDCISVSIPAPVLVQLHTVGNRIICSLGINQYIKLLVYSIWSFFFCISPKVRFFVLWSGVPAPSSPRWKGLQLQTRDSCANSINLLWDLKYPLKSTKIFTWFAWFYKPRWDLTCPYRVDCTAYNSKFKFQTPRGTPKRARNQWICGFVGGVGGHKSVERLWRTSILHTVVL